MWQRFETYVTAPVSLVDFLLQMLSRACHFGVFFAGFLTRRQNLFGVLFFVPAYALAALALWQRRSGGPAVADRRSDVLFASLGFVSAFWLFHAAVRVDFDWRYRLPVLPHLILLAALAFDGGLPWGFATKWVPARKYSPPPAPPPR